MSGIHDDDERIEAAITEAMLEIFERQEAGEELSDAEILARYPSIAEPLIERLRAPVKPENLPTLSEQPKVGKPVSPPVDLPGYTNIRELRRGGQATVFSAVQQSTGQRVAIKVIHGGRFIEDRARQRFLREIKLLASLNHRNIVTIINQGEAPDGSAYLIMQFVDGIALDDYVKQWRHAHPDAGPAPEPLLRLFVKIAHAVDAAHRRGIVHRDLKPSNILVDRYGEPCILDFGLARAAAAMDLETSQSLELTRTGQFLGSLPWASPEQAHGDAGSVDARSDVYALGLLLYNMLTGDMPYKVTGSLHEVINNIISAVPTPMTESLSISDSTQRKFIRRYHRIRRWRAVHPCLEAVVLLALAKSADGRYSTAGAMADDLELFLNGEKTFAWIKMRKRSRRMSAVVIGVLLLSGVVAVASLPRSVTDGTVPTHKAELPPWQPVELTAHNLRNTMLAKATPFDGHSYLLLDTNRTWEECRKQAEQYGGYLAVITSRAEILFLAEHLGVGDGRRGRADWIGCESNGKDIFRSITGEHVNIRPWYGRLVPPVDKVMGVTVLGMTWGLSDKDVPLGMVVEWDHLATQRFRKHERPGYEWSVPFQGSRYLLVKEQTSWRRAKKICEEMGGDLVCIESPEEEAFLLTLEGFSELRRKPFIGACFYDAQFSWVNGRNIKYRNWAQEPRMPEMLGAKVYLTEEGWYATTPIDHGGPGPYICEWSDSE